MRLFTVVAIGGMGKSALTWKWFNDIAPNELPPRGAHVVELLRERRLFENFVIRALAYAAGLPEAEVRQMPATGVKTSSGRCSTSGPSCWCSTAGAHPARLCAHGRRAPAG